MSDSFLPEKPPDFPPGIIIPQPLIYPDISGQGIYTNVLLIDNQVADCQYMANSVNASTFPIIYSIYSNKTELLTLLQTHFTTIERIALAFISSLSESRYFLDNQPLFLENETQPYSENVQFILDLTSQFQVQHLDYLACDTLNYANWNSYYDLLKQNTMAVIGASSDKTGNIYYGGDWVLENTSENVEFIYFSVSIEYYKYLLDTIVSREKNVPLLTLSNHSSTFDDPTIFGATMPFYFHFEQVTPYLNQPISSATSTPLWPY